MIKSLEKTLCLKIFISNPIKVAKILTTVSKIPLSITMQILLGKISVWFNYYPLVAWFEFVNIISVDELLKERNL